MGASINEGKNFLMKMKNTNNFCSVLPLLCIDKTKIEKLCSVKEISTKYKIQHCSDNYTTQHTHTQHSIFSTQPSI